MFRKCVHTWEERESRVSIKSPLSGAEIGYSTQTKENQKLVISVSGAYRRGVRVNVNGVQKARLPPHASEFEEHILDLGNWTLGIHLIEAVWDNYDDDVGEVEKGARGGGVLADSVAVLVHSVEDRVLPDYFGGFNCPFTTRPLNSTPISVMRSVSHDVGFGRGQWQEYRTCLNVWMKMHPTSSAGLYELGKLAEVQNELEEAIALYRSAADLSYPLIRDRLAELSQLAHHESEKSVCTWNSTLESTMSGWGLGEEESMRNDSDDGVSCRLGQRGRCTTPNDAKADLFLSVILVARHDSTLFCQV